jgi:glutamate transport system substrate-binding protein
MSSTKLTRPRTRAAAGGAALVVTAALTLTGCGSSGSAPKVPGGSDSGSGNAASGSTYDSIVTSSPVASASEVSGNSWAAKIKKQGYLKVGGTDAGPLFSLKDPATGKVTGFDAGLSQMLAHYITGGKDVQSLTKLTITTVDTRETLLQNHTVDAVFATYTITPERAQKVAFAGPYYESGDAIMVKKDNNDIKTVKDLDGKNVVTETNSTAALSIKKFAPQAKVILQQQDAQCVAAVQQGRADAYVLDQGILISDASTNPAVKVVGQPFTKEPYGIGLPKDDPAAKQFVNAWLKKIFKDGSWQKLWNATIGTVVSGNAPSVPAIGSVPGS